MHRVLVQGQRRLFERARRLQTERNSPKSLHLHLEAELEVLMQRLRSFNKRRSAPSRPGLRQSRQQDGSRLTVIEREQHAAEAMIDFVLMLSPHLGRYGTRQMFERQ